MDRLRQVLALTSGLLLVAGCASLSHAVGTPAAQAAGCGPSPGVVLILGAHRAAPMTALDQPVTCLLTATINAGKPVLIVVAAGQPELITPKLASVHGGSLAQQNSPWAQQDFQHLQAVIAGIRPDSPGVDDLAALSVAADAARSAGIPHADLIVLDSGLDDRGALDFTVPGMVAATPSEAVGELARSGNVPDLDGFRVLLVGLGYTAPPQPPLPARWRANVTQIWTRLVTSARAKVRMIPQPPTRDVSVTTSMPVKLIPVPADPPVRPADRTTIVFTQESAVRFLPDSSAFADRTTAAKALAPIARWLAANRSRHAWLVGTTADVNSLADQIRLSILRAGHVRDVLMAQGALAAQISTRGVGSDFPQFIPDRNSTGILLAGPATLNRSVRITLGSSQS
jgi:outer membrane protein OmpA-like peptidoglycan-associated protein